MRKSELIKPRRLYPGSRIGICSPASPPEDEGTVDKCVEAVKKLGFEPVLSSNARARAGYLAGSDAARAEDLVSLFRDKSIDGIFPIRGGYGTARILNRLDYSVIQENPKPFIGYSDITSLHCAIYQASKVVTFHGPNIDGAMVRDEENKFTVDKAMKALCTSEPPGDICSNYGDKDSEVYTIHDGRVTSELIGGNLTILTTIVATAFQPTFLNKILFIEDINESPYRMDRYLTFLHNTGILKQIAGVAIGQCKGCDIPEDQEIRPGELNLEGVFRDRLQHLGIPVVANLPFGHVKHNATLPMGVMATLDASLQTLIIEESGVRD
jgi:muramoyltetrapeptide carboxypeptidase